MAITDATGVVGDVTLPTGYNVKADTWSLSISQALIPTTGFGDTYETNVGGLKRGAWSVTGTPQYDAANTNPGINDTVSAPQSGFVFQVAPNCTFTCSGIVVNGTASSDVAGAARVSYSGVTSSSVVDAWDEGA
jgi:hypothetical protein